MCHCFAEAGGQEALGDRGADAEGMSEPERARGILHPSGDIEFRVARSIASPLAEIPDVVHGIVPEQGLLGVEHGRHMTGIEKEAVAQRPGHIGRVVVQELRVEDVDEIGAAHGTTGMPGLGFFHHSGG